MGGSHVVDSSSWTRTLSHCYLHKILEFILILCNGMLNQLQNWILRQLVHLWILMLPALSSYTMLAWFIRVGLTLSSLCA